MASRWGARLPPCWVIAVTILLDDCDKRELIRMDELDAIIPPRIPPEVHPSWLLLGYDVADEGLLSGLSNCGYDPVYDGLESIRARWGPHLNVFHLFNDHSEAYEFKQFSDRRVEEHAPFYVYGLWLISAAVIEESPSG